MSSIDYSELEAAYEDAKFGTEEPYLGVMSLHLAARLRMEHTGESYEVAYQYIIDHSELVDIDGEPMYHFSDSLTSELVEP